MNEKLIKVALFDFTLAKQWASQTEKSKLAMHTAQYNELSVKDTIRLEFKKARFNCRKLCLKAINDQNVDQSTKAELSIILEDVNALTLRITMMNLLDFSDVKSQQIH